MKRLLSLIVIATSLVLLAACGGGSDAPPETSQPATAGDAAATSSDGEGSDSGEGAASDDSASTPDATQDDATQDDAMQDDSTPVEPAATAEPEAAPVEPTEAEAVATDDAAEFAPVSFQDDFGTSIAPIFANKCASCHNAGGPGEAHWRLQTAADLVDSHQWVSGVVNTQYMPPWPASDLSPAFHDDRSLRPDEIAAIVEWSTAGAPLDVDGATPISAPEGVESLDADVEIGPHEPFQGSPAVVDDYRCLIYDLELTEPAWMQGFEFVPDKTQIVHHAIGYLAPASAMDQALELSAQDDLGGWQCYGSSGLNDGDDLFLGWAPGQLPTEFPEGSGLLAQPGDFVVLQIHYHFDTADAPEDASTLKIDWAEGDGLDPIEFDEFLAPAEIPCSSDETGPLCDRETALVAAYEKYGVPGVLADNINRFCGVTPADFADMTDGIATSSCELPIRNAGVIVSVFGHQHEVGKSIRMTLNPGRSDELVLFDIPDWSFDWQYNYYPVEDILVSPGDTVLLECSWDRDRRDPALEPAYILWADGTNDEMCFATISTRVMGGGSAGDDAGASDDPFDAAALRLDLPDELVSCMAAAGIEVDRPPTRDELDEFVDQLFMCEDAATVGQILADQLAANFGEIIAPQGGDCLAQGLADKDAARSLLTFTLVDSTVEERTPLAELVGSCIGLSDALAAFGFPMPESAVACIDEAGRPVLVQTIIDGELPEEQTLFRTIGPCLTGD